MAEDKLIEFKNEASGTVLQRDAADEQEVVNHVKKTPKKRHAWAARPGTHHS